VYTVFIDFDKNTTSGDDSDSDSDIGYEVYFELYVEFSAPGIETGLYLEIWGGGSYDVDFNMTANNGTAVYWDAPGIADYFQCVLFSNSSQAEIIFGVNWTWLTRDLHLAGNVGDNCTMYLEFQGGAATDWCPDRTGGDTDYFEWDLCAKSSGIPGFSLSLALISLLTIFSVPILLRRTRLRV
jgi:hypothetical protein